jgi:hypothetical protein
MAFGCAGVASSNAPNYAMLLRSGNCESVYKETSVP